ncbi:hypothetical protein NX059_012509 [Plenodomus lindquistii]|nr:hypothetical protein NX059_012509 [Plenodomus lindquistii]
MLSSFSTSPPPTTHTPRTRKSTNKYTQKNNRYRDRLLALEGHKLAIARARSANNTYISRAKTALLLRKKAELENLSEANQSLAHKEITRAALGNSLDPESTNRRTHRPVAFVEYCTIKRGYYKEAIQRV